METIEIRVHEDITIREEMKARSREQGFRRYTGEIISRDEWCWDESSWVFKTRVIDTKHDWYHERVINPKTGAIIYECAEPLSVHQGHGSAKKRPQRH
jgi:hypothetical protein